MKFLKNLHCLGKDGQSLFGAKAFSLGWMMNHGQNVPGGFVISCKAFDIHMSKNCLYGTVQAILSDTGKDDSQRLKEASDRIRQIIVKSPVPQEIALEVMHAFKKLSAECVAVRSSATCEDSKDAAWAGQFDSYLNTKEESLLENIRRCWASLFSTRALLYQDKKGFSGTSISMAVIIQKMVQSEKSGVAFSVHPVGNDNSRLLIEAGFGLGDSIVSGTITPDIFVVDKNTLKPVHMRIASHIRVLNKQELVSLSKSIKNIEQLFGYPVDVEFAIEKNSIYITQSRPITAFSRICHSPLYMMLIHEFEKNNYGHKITKHEGTFSLLAWGTAPYCIYSPFYKKYYQQDFGPIVFIASDKQGIGFFSLENYRLATMCTLEKCLGSGNGFTELKDFASLGRRVESLYNNSHPEVLKALSLNGLRQKIVRCFEMLRDWQAITLFSEALENDIIKKYFGLLDAGVDFTQFMDAASALDFLTLNQMIKKSLIEKDKGSYASQWIHSGYLYAPPLDECSLLCGQKLLEFGGIGKIHHDLEKAYTDMEHNRIASERLRGQLTGKAIELFDFVKTGILIRDTRKETAFRIVAILSNSLRELFSRNGLDEKKIIYCSFEDFIRPMKIDKDYENTLEQRKKGVLAYYGPDGVRLAYADYNEAKNKLMYALQKKDNSSDDIKGDIANPGYAKACAKIVLCEADFSKFEEGDILVTSMTRPEFVPLMKKASAVITDEGGITCHAAIVAREFRLPCITGTRIATRTFKDFDIIEVDANLGIIRLNQEPS